MKMPKWLKKSANNHEAGSSSGWRRRSDSRLGETLRCPHVVPPPPQAHIVTSLFC
jgi:hypothetical protein